MISAHEANFSPFKSFYIFFSVRWCNSSFVIELCIPSHGCNWFCGCYMYLRSRLIIWSGLVDLTGFVHLTSLSVTPISVLSINPWQNCCSPNNKVEICLYVPSPLYKEKSKLCIYWFINYTPYLDTILVGIYIYVRVSSFFLLFVFCYF